MHNILTNWWRLRNGFLLNKRAGLLLSGNVTIVDHGFTIIMEICTYDTIGRFICWTWSFKSRGLNTNVYNHPANMDQGQIKMIILLEPFLKARWLLPTSTFTLTPFPFSLTPFPPSQDLMKHQKIQLLIPDVENMEMDDK